MWKVRGCTLLQRRLFSPKGPGPWRDTAPQEPSLSLVGREKGGRRLHADHDRLPVTVPRSQRRAARASRGHVPRASAQESSPEAHSTVGPSFSHPTPGEGFTSSRLPGREPAPAPPLPAPCWHHSPFPTSTRWSAVSTSGRDAPRMRSFLSCPRDGGRLLVGCS